MRRSAEQHDRADAGAETGSSAHPGEEFRIAAIILNYKTPGLVIDCLRSAAPELRPDVDRLIVVDNASGDDSVPRIRQELERAGWPHASLLESPDNGGFAAGNNVGIRSINARAYLLLNSDTVVRAGAPEILFSALMADAAIGLTSPRLEWPDGEPQISCFRCHSIPSEVIAGSQTGPIRKLLSHWDVPIDVVDHPTESGWTSFAAVMIRREVFERIGLLDDGFFMYYEDVDFCRRAGLAGFRILNQPAAHVVHLRGGSSPVKSLQSQGKRRPRYFYESRSRYFRKAYGPLGALLANTSWTLGRSISYARELAGNKQPHTVAHELYDNWRG